MATIERVTIAVLEQLPALRELTWKRSFSIEEAEAICDLAQQKHIVLHELWIETSWGTNDVNTVSWEEKNTQFAHYFPLLKRISACECVRELHLDRCYFSFEMMQTLLTGNGMHHVLALSLPHVSPDSPSYVTMRNVIESIYPLLSTCLPHLSALRYIPYPPSSVSALTPLYSLHALRSLTFVDYQRVERIDTNAVQGMISFLLRMAPTLTSLEVPWQIAVCIATSVTHIHQLAPLRNLQVFYLRDTLRERVECSVDLLRAFCETFPNITTFPYKRYDKKMRLQHLSPILSLRALQEISFTSCKVITDGFIDALVTSCPNLYSIGLSNCPFLTMSIFRSFLRSTSLRFFMIDQCNGVPHPSDWTGFIRSSRELICKTCVLGSILTAELIRKNIPLLEEWDRRYVLIPWFNYEDDSMMDDKKDDAIIIDRYEFFYSLVHHLPIPIKLHGLLDGKKKLLTTETISYKEFVARTRPVRVRSRTSSYEKEDKLQIATFLWSSKLSRNGRYHF